MKDTFETLEQVLKSELESHTELLATALEFNRAIREEDMDRIDRERTTHDEVICRIERLEEQRIACFATLARSLGVAGKNLRLAKLLEKAPPQWRERLCAIQKLLRDKMDEVSRITISNRIFLEEGLKVVANTFVMLREASGKYPCYGNRGESVSGPAFNSFINKTV